MKVFKKLKVWIEGRGTSGDKAKHPGPQVRSIATKLKLPADFSRLTIDRRIEYCYPYPPYGFYWFGECDLGNGDVFGLYWPVGKEDQEPIVGLTAHDGHQVLPQYSNLAKFFEHLGLAKTAAEEEDEKLDWSEMFPSDPNLKTDDLSPIALFESGKAAMKDNQPQAAIKFFEHALTVLPEYKGASTMLAALYNRLGQWESAFYQTLKAVISPGCFGESDDRQLQWLQRQRRCPHGCESDPLWLNCNKLTVKYGGVKTNDNYLVLAEIIEHYVAMGRKWEAIVLSMRYAELMFSETTSFQERYGFEAGKHGEKMRELIDRVAAKSRDL